MIGSTIKVVATAESGNTFESEETEEVGVYEALEILSAEQTGANTVLVTFSAPATVDDELEVFKGSVEQTIADQEFADNTYTSKILTFKNNLATGTYTVTLTPADEDVDPSSVTFEATAATKANTIEIQGNKLVMKDTSYKEGYFFIKGYNEFGEEIPLSGLDVTVAPSDDGGVSFDSSTGKVTVKYNDGFAILRNVSAFAQYTTADGTIITDQETLEVSTIGYPSVIEFGEVKRDGDGGREDGLLTIDELTSNKYYVELNTVKDQYGNDLSADDLNDLADPANKLLTVIPQAGSPVFFGTNGTPFTEKGGKVVVFLTPGNGRPGTGTLMITGAGGSFDKEIEIFDNPYIETLNVDIPDLYVKEWTDVFSFSAVDEYGEEYADESDLYEFAPANGTAQTTLWFDDFNDLVTQATRIIASDNGTWKVEKDTVKKTFTVKYKPNDATTDKGIVSFTIITAGLNTTVKTVRVNSRGTAGTIVAQASAETMNNYDAKVNLNSKVSFKDANGKVMVRTDCYDVYPQFLDDPSTITINSGIDDDTITSYWWCVTEDKLPDDKAAGDAIGNYDADGVIKVALASTLDADGNNTALDEDDTNDADELLANASNATPSYYVTLLGKSGANYKVLDRKTYRFNYSPAAARLGEKYTVTAIKSSELLYAKKGSTDTTTIEVMAKNASGEVYKPDQSLVSLIADAPFTTAGAVVSGDIGSASLPGGDTGTVSVKVYYNGESIDTVSIPYSNADPVPTSTEIKLKTTTRMGSNWDAATTLKSFTTCSTEVADASMTDGVLVINNVNEFKDKLTAQIKDQYGLSMKSSKVKVNGYEMGAAEVAAFATKDEIANFVMTNGSQKIDFELVAGRTTGNNSITTAAATVSKDEVLNEVESWDDLVTTLKDAAAGDIDLVDENGDATTTIKITDNVEATSALVIPAGYTVEVDDGVTFDTASYRVEVKATAGLTVNGDWYANGAVITVDGDVVVGVDGDAYLNNCTLQGTGTWNGNALTINLSGCTLKGGTFAGHVVITDTTKISGSITFDDATVESDADLTITSTVTLAGNTTLDLTGSTLTGADNIAVGDNFAGTIKDQGGNDVAVGETGDFVLIDGDADNANEVAKFLEDYGTVLELKAEDVATWYEASHTAIATALAKFGTDDGDLSAAAQEALATEKEILDDLNAAATAYADVKAAVASLKNAADNLAANTSASAGAGLKSTADEALSSADTAIRNLNTATGTTTFDGSTGTSTEEEAYKDAADKIQAYSDAETAIGTNSQAGTLGFRAAVGTLASAPANAGSTKFSEWETALKNAFEGADDGNDCEFTWGVSTFKATPISSGSEGAKAGDETTLGTTGDINTITYSVTVSQAGYVAEFTATLNAVVQ